jgi:lipoyl synthase
VRSSYHADVQHAQADLDRGWLFGASDPLAAHTG